MREEGDLKSRDRRLPNFLIIGAMRSGTTSLARYLGDHPEVFMTPGKEIHFFDRNYERGVTWYMEHFRGVTNEAAIGEATQTYMFESSAIPRIARFIPGAKLIAILRNPVDRAYSHYWHNRARGREVLSFPDAIAAEGERLVSGDRLSRPRYSYVARGRYLEQLLRTTRFFRREALHVVIFEDLRDEPWKTYQSVCRFLGVDDGIRVPIVGRPLNPFVRLRSIALRDAARKLPSWARNALGKVNARSDTYPPMDPVTRLKLAGMFREDNLRLMQWLGRDTTVWEESGGRTDS